MAGTYATAQTVTIGEASNGATIYYTTDGTTPTTGSAVYSTPLTVSESETLSAMATAPGLANSAVASAAYYIGSPAATPTFSPAAGTYTTVQTVSISDSTPSPTIYYTTNGSTPTAASSVYSGPITVATSETINAIATAAGYIQSAPASAVYTLNLPTAATPAFSPAAGTYNTVQTVTISDTTGGATIYCTTNGTAPTTASSVDSAPISVSVTQTLEAIATATGDVNSAVQSGVYTIAAATPTFTPAAGTYNTAQTVTISDTTAGSTIYYTTNGMAPTTASSLYSAPVSISTTQTLEAIAVEAGYTNSSVKSGVYTITAATPGFSPAAGTYSTTQTVTISDTTSGTTIYYTTNGTAPTTASSPYSAPITVSTTQTLEAIAVEAGYSNSAVGSAVYTIAVTTPTFSPAAGTYSSVQTVTISDTTSGASIYYTTNGNTPTTASSLYSVPITVSAAQTLKAIAVETGLTNSAVGSAAYTFAAATPTFSPAAGSYTGPQTVTISDTSSGATIHYTTNGTAPTSASSVYSAPISVSATQTLEALAVETGFSNSAVGTARYTLTAATPTFSPATGTYNTAQTVTISTTTPSATIHYTITAGTTGTTPTTSSTTYTGPIVVPATSVLEALATATNNTTSAVGSVTYTFSFSGVATPSYVQQCSAYAANVTTRSCTLSGVTAGDALVIGIWAASPNLTSVTASSGTPSSVISNLSSAGGYGYVSSYLLSNSSAGSITLTATESASVDLWMAVTEYTNVTASPLDGSGNGKSGTTTYGPTNVNSSNFTTTANSDLLWSFCSGQYGIWDPGTAPITWTERVTATPVNSEGLFIEDGTAGAAGTYYGQCYKSSSADFMDIITVALKGAPEVVTPTFSPAAGAYTSAQTVTISDTTPGSTIYYTTDGTTPTTASSVYSIPITVSSSETLNALGVLSGDANSATGSAAYTIAAATPTFSPAAGSYGSAQSVSISDATANSTIYYTTNGSVPTIGSPVYSAAITVSGAETLQAIAVASGYGTSAASTAAYTIPPYTPVLSLAAGSYYGSQTVTITDATPGATIYYTTNATVPTTNSATYTAPLAITATQTVEAIAATGGAPSSAVTSALYTIATPAALTIPTPDISAQLSGTSVAFAWTPGNTAKNFEFWVGTTNVGSSNLYNSGNVTATTETVTDLPNNGEAVYARLYYLINGAWQYTDYTYVASGAPTQAVLTTPAPNTTTPLTGTSVAFSWNPGNTATHFEFWVGTTGVGSSNLYNSGNITATTETVSNLPINGGTVYVRLYSLINGGWEYADYTYTAY